MSEIFFDLAEFGVKKMINAGLIESYDFSNTQPDRKKESYVVGLMVNGAEIRVDFKTKENFKHRVDALSLVII